MRDDPLYNVARMVCHDAGIPWTDPRTGKTYPPPRKPRVVRVKRKRTGAKRKPTGTWETLCRRTNYPKLGYIIAKLKEKGIPCRFSGFRTFHADHILLVPKYLYLEASEILDERHGRYRLDDVRDDHPKFLPYNGIKPETPL